MRKRDVLKVVGLGVVGGYVGWRFFGIPGAVVGAATAVGVALNI